MIWFTADTHFYHQNIIRLCNRPFLDLNHMHEYMIEQWNKTVANMDTVYHLGDYGAFKNKRDTIASLKLIDRLNGKIHLITGNHDKRLLKEHTNEFRSIQPYAMLSAGNKPIILFHYPIHSWASKNYGAIHLHGHSHGKTEQIKNRIDVGVDCWNYRPVSILEILGAK